MVQFNCMRRELPDGVKSGLTVSLAQRAGVGQMRLRKLTWRPPIFPDILADPAVLLPFIAIGFAAQMIDGALGMAFGQISSTLLVSMGVPPAAASAGVHTAETFTTAVSGISHVAHGNVVGDCSSASSFRA
jgi:hypothetical protein